VKRESWIVSLVTLGYSVCMVETDQMNPFRQSRSAILVTRRSRSRSQKGFRVQHRSVGLLESAGYSEGAVVKTLQG